MYFTAGSVAAVFMACTASQIPIVEGFPPPRVEKALPSRVCSPMAKVDMSIESTPDFGSAGAELPEASRAPRNPKPSMKMITVTMMKPHITAAVTFRKSFIWNANFIKSSKFA